MSAAGAPIDFQRVTAAPLDAAARPAAVRMRDGVALAADVYLPGGDDSPGDTVLIRLPYDKCGSYCFIPLIAEYFMSRGYRVVAQDVRGKFRSQGAALLFVNEADDGYDTIEWITRQPWSNGRVAMWGDSYYGYTQLAAAASGHPALKAISPRVTGTGLGEPVAPSPRDGVRAVEKCETLLYPLEHFFEQDTYYWEMDWGRREFAAQCEEFMATIGRRSISYDQWYPHPVILPRFPARDAFVGRSVPTLQTIGWWDNCAPNSWADFSAIQKHHQNWVAHWYLRIEPIDHENYFLVQPAADRVEERSVEQIRALLPAELDPTLDFFEVFVRGRGSATDIARVTWNLAGTDQWRVEPAWPPVDAVPTTLRALAGEHDTDGQGSGGRLAVAGAGGLGPDDTCPARDVSWTHDPGDLVPSSVDNPFAFLLTSPDEAPIGNRDDVLMFTSCPVADDVELAGPVTGRATICSTGPVIDLFIRLLDVAPDGTALRIARGQVEAVDATKPRTVDIDLGQLGYLLQAGHRLRLHISSSDYPEFVPQPGDGSDPWAWASTAVNTQTVVTGGPDGLTVTLPVLRGKLS